MFKTLQNAFKIKDIRDRLLYTFLMLVVIRLGSQLPIPGVKTTFFAELFAKQNNDAFGFFNTIIGAMITDVIDDSEVKNGIREDGTIYAVYSFARKLGQAASSGLIGGLLSLVGYFF